MIKQQTFKRYDPYAVSPPASRRLRIYAIDPSLERELETALINRITVEVPWVDNPDINLQEGPLPGPIGQYVEVIDYDPASGCCYEPLDLNQPYLLAQNGLDPSEGNPQFHQQMLYAVVMTTIKNFERALGRCVLWSPHRMNEIEDRRDEPVLRLRIYPHAIREANAFYSPSKKALLFGYFPASPLDPGKHLPGGMVFTCLSHDIIAHETTHALLDGVHRRYIEPTNPDVLAFHEAFADIVAIFQHFTFPEVVRHQIAKTRGDLESSNLLAQLAVQFGKAIGRSDALRQAIGTEPQPLLIEQTFEPHARGALLVAAVFDAFLLIYKYRTADLIRIATSGTGVLPEGELHPDLVNRLAAEASKAANHVLTICIRALDYMPPVDATFGDYLRSLITADYDLVPDDDKGYRIAFIEAFRRRGLYPANIRSLSMESLLWENPKKYEAGNDRIPFVQQLDDVLRSWRMSSDRLKTYNEMEEIREKIHAVFDESRSYKQDVLSGLQLVGYDEDTRLPLEVHSVRPVLRVGPESQLLTDVLIEVTQRLPGFYSKSYDEIRNLDPRDYDSISRHNSSERPDFWFRGGCTIILDSENGEIRYCIPKYINDSQRYEQQRSYLSGDQLDPSLRETYYGVAEPDSEEEELFAILHRLGDSEEI